MGPETLLRNLHLRTEKKDATKATPKKRVRRTAEVSKDEILNAAENVLLDHGPQDLKIAEIARVSGIGHPTIIHHFGSIAGVQQALALRMNERVVKEMTEISREAIERRGIVPELVARAFDVYARPENAKLIAWLILTNQTEYLNALDAQILELKNDIQTRMRDTGRAHNASDEKLAGMMSIVTMTALGEGLGRGAVARPLAKALGQNQIRDWIGALVFQKANEGH